jgi:SPP1 gp7 family putative phage head morphogenesis protein
MCVKCGFITLADRPELEGLEPEVKRIAKLIYDGKIKAGDIDPAMVKKIAQQLMRGVFSGYGKNLTNKDLTDAERSFLTKIEANVYVFSGFKNYQQLKETTLLLKNDSGKLKPFNEFLNDVKSVNETYNEVYLNAEYGTAVASAQTAATWQDYENAGVDMLTYVTAGDDRVRAEHAILEGVTYPVDHEFWDTYYPPNDWGCRCDTIPSVGEKQVPISSGDLPELPEMFQNNVGKSGVLFPDTHPYYDVPGKTAKEILQQVDDILPPDTSTQTQYESDSGGSVEVEGGVNKKELKDNMEVSKVLADAGHKVRLLAIDRTPGVKNPDALVDEKTFEFKTNKTPTISAIDNELRAAKDQADHIVVNIKSKITADDLSYAISSRMSRSKNVKDVWLIYKDDLIKIPKENLLNKEKILKAIKKGK